MKPQLANYSHVLRHRVHLKKLVSPIEKKPFDYLPERSVECLKQFLTGYEIFGPSVWRDLASFEFWLKQRLEYPDDTGSRWWRFIQLNSRDRCDSFDSFFRLYWNYCKQEPMDVQPNAPELRWGSNNFDFYQLLYAISKKPGLYLGSSVTVQSLAACLAGYFSGKKHSGKGLTDDEKRFHQFSKWLSKRHNLKREYSWNRLVEMWSIEQYSFQEFFVNYDAFLTNYGKKVGGLDDLFETVKDDLGTTIRRREKLPEKVLRIPGSPMWWRSAYNR